jgi:hypothetical protein
LINYTATFFGSVQLTEQNTTASTVTVGYFSSFNSSSNTFVLLGGDSCGNNSTISATVSLLCANNSFIDLSPPFVSSSQAEQPCSYNLVLGGHDYCIPGQTESKTSASKYGAKGFIAIIVIASILLPLVGGVCFVCSRQFCCHENGTVVYDAIEITPRNAAAIAELRIINEPFELELPVYGLDGTAMKEFSNSTAARRDFVVAMFMDHDEPIAEEDISSVSDAGFEIYVDTSTNDVPVVADG